MKDKKLLHTIRKWLFLRYQHNQGIEAEEVQKWLRKLTEYLDKHSQEEPSVEYERAWKSGHKSATEDFEFAVRAAWMDEEGTRADVRVLVAHLENIKKSH